MPPVSGVSKHEGDTLRDRPCPPFHGQQRWTLTTHIPGHMHTPMHVLSLQTNVHAHTQTHLPPTTRAHPSPAHTHTLTYMLTHSLTHTSALCTHKQTLTHSSHSLSYTTRNAPTHSHMCTQKTFTLLHTTRHTLAHTRTLTHAHTVYKDTEGRGVQCPWMALRVRLASVSAQVPLTWDDTFEISAGASLLRVDPLHLQPSSAACCVARG